MFRKDFVLTLRINWSRAFALTRSLSPFGCGLPQVVFGATAINSSGRWDVDVININVGYMTRRALANDASMRFEEVNNDEKVDG